MAIERLARHCRENDIRFIIVNYPELRELHKYPFRWIDERLSALASRLEAEYVQLLPAVKDRSPPDLWVSAPDPHPNALAHQLYAEYLAHYLLSSVRELQRPFQR